ncbi:MAG: hypothetical protein AAGB51_10005 [Planctomycetota bacterium]
MTTGSSEPLYLAGLGTPLGVEHVRVTWLLDRAPFVAERGPIELTWTLATRGPSTADIVDRFGATRRLRAVETGTSWRFDAERGLLHADIPPTSEDEGSLCSVTVSLSRDRPRLLYARTELLRSVGVPGGCAEVRSFSAGTA